MKIKMLATTVAIGCVGTLAIAASVDGSAVAQTVEPIHQILEADGVALVMPSYVPTGFELTSFEMRYIGDNSYNPTYGYTATYTTRYSRRSDTTTYSSRYDRCKITVSGDLYHSLGRANWYPFEEVSTPLFGNIFLGKVSTGQPDFADQSWWNSLVGRMDPTTQALPGFPDAAYNFRFSCEDSDFSIQEAAKILKSMQIVE